MKKDFVLLPLICITCFSLTSVGRPRVNVQVEVNPQTGSYTVQADDLHWLFKGSVGQSVNDLQATAGTDKIGSFEIINFKWGKNNEYSGSIRWYKHTPVVLFSLSIPEGGKHALPAFPAFTSIPKLPYHFSYHNHIFALPQFLLEETSTPWLLFNDLTDACVISPASDFMVARLTGNGEDSISSGLNQEITDLPPHFTHSTIMVLDHGIRKTWDEWGNALRKLYNRKRPANDADPVLKYYGYWTDNGADYYYNYDTTKGYAGTLLAVRSHYKKEGIPLGYMQLDSWWYEKSHYNMEGHYHVGSKKSQFPAGGWNLSGGLMTYRADTFLFPNGLAAFQQKLGLPLVTHSRWIDPRSPYHKKYKISGFAAIDTAFWRYIMNYLKNAGVVCYEQDWLNYIYSKDPQMISTLNAGNEFTDGMAQAAQADGISLQYCMAMPRYFMQGLKYNNLTTIRPSGDGFQPERWMNFIFTSQLAYEMGIWPWCDVFKSHETGNMIVSVLSAGPVGTGDAIGKEDKANIMKACRHDGVLVKPDVPLLPMDKDYIQIARHEGKPILAYTYTRHTNVTTDYVFAFADANTTDTRIAFKPSDIGMKGNVVVYNPLSNNIRVQSSRKEFIDNLPAEKYTYYIIAPITSSGIAFLGDTGKIAATGKKRIADMTASGNNLRVKVFFAKGESEVILHGYHERAVSADKGKMTLDKATHLFTLSLPAPASGNIVNVNFMTK